MKKQKFVSSILIASMLLSLCSCSGDNKTVLAVADAYAQAVAGFDTDDIADLMDGDTAQNALERFEAVYDDNSKLKPAYDAVLGSITYEIDKKSVESSKKDKKASVEITYTLVDYEAVYDEVFDDGGTIDDFIAALEDNDGKDTVEITQKLEFSYRGDKWLVKDKKLKAINEIYAFLDDMPEYGWGNFRDISSKDFKNAIKRVFQVDDEDIYESSFTDSVEFSYDDDNVMTSYAKYHNKEDASREFADMFSSIEMQLYRSDNNGKYVYSNNGEIGYLLLNNVYFEDFEGYMYGGVYMKGDTLILVLVLSTDIPDHTQADQLLDELGYPKPY